MASLDTAAAASAPAGRWEGEAHIPETPQRVVLDLAPDTAGDWAGSLTLPGRGVKGAPLETLKVGADGTVQADAARAFGGPPSDLPTQLALRMLPDGRLEGEWRQGGHAARLTLRRSGEAQVDVPPSRTALPAALAGVWRGRYELGGYPRDVTLTLQATTSPGSQAGELLIDRFSAAISAAPDAVHLVASASTLAGWQRYTRDRQWLNGLAAKQRLLVLSGDIHRNELDAFYTGGWPLHEATSSGAAVKDAVVVGAERQNYGLLDIDTDVVTVSLFNKNKLEQSRTLNRATWLPR